MVKWISPEGGMCCSRYDPSNGGARARQPTKSEILDATDLALRLHWAYLEAQINEKSAPGKLDE